MTVESYPLYWPAGWPRSSSAQRAKSRFNGQTFSQIKELQRELRLLGARNVIISSNVPVRQDGLPHHRAEQVLLGREVEINRALADARGGGDILQLGRGIAALGERGERGGDDLAGTGILAAGAWHEWYLLTVQSVSTPIARRRP